MDLFVVDTVGENSCSFAEEIKENPRLSATYLSPFVRSIPIEVSKPPVDEESDDDDDYGGLPPPSESISMILSDDFGDTLSCLPTLQQMKQLKGPAFVEDKQASTSKRSPKRQKITQHDELSRTDVNEEMKNAVLTPGIEKKENITHLGMSDEALRKLNRKERNKTKGRNWFNMSAPEVTPELRNELELIKMRSVLDPKKAFGRVEKRSTPKYFEVGKVLDSPLDHFSERGVKKTKAQTLVDELLADAKFQKYNKRKYAEALEKKKKKAYHKAVLKMKKDKKKKK